MVAIGRDAPALPEPVDLPSTLSRALEASYQVLEARTALEQAQQQTLTAGEATRPRLDLQGWVQTQGLGNQSFEGTFEQLGRFSNVSANLAVVFELPLSSERHDAQVQQATVAVLAATERLTAARVEVEGQAKKEVDLLSQAQRNVALARRAAEVAQRSQGAQRARFERGASTALDVGEAEDAARRTQLSVERERVNAAKARIRAWHLVGELLPRYLAN